MTSTDGAGPAEGPRDQPRDTVTVGDRVFTIQRPNGRKASRAFALLKALGQAVPGFVDEWGAFTRRYEEANTVKLTRAQAQMEFPPRTVYGDAAAELGVDDGTVIPSRIAHLTDEDWERSGQVLELGQSPSREQVMMAVVPKLLDDAEQEVMRLVALFTFTNDEVKRSWRERDTKAFEAVLDERVDELLDDGHFDELIELAVVCGETVDHHFTRKTRELGDRLGNAMRLLGREQAPTPAPAQESTSTSPTPTTPTPPSDPNPETPAATTPTDPSTSDASASSSRLNGSSASEAPSIGAPMPSSTSPST